MAQELQADSIRLEPALIVDGTGSMKGAVSPGSSMTKRTLATSIARTLAKALGEKDSQAPDEEEGGLLTVSFADGLANEVGDLNEDNFDEKWSTIVWSGGTYIMPAFQMVMKNFQDEFGKLPVAIQPKLALAVITDGELFDMIEATNWLRATAGNVYVTVVVLGSGADHNKAVKQWKTISETNSHVGVEDVAEGSTDARGIADRLLNRLQ